MIFIPTFALRASLLFIAFTWGAQAKPVPHKKESASLHISTADKAARQRMHNRALLLTKARQKLPVVPATPAQIIQAEEKKKRERKKNREILALYSAWRPGRFGGSEQLWSPVGEEVSLSSPLSVRLQASLRQVISRLKKQLGKPYVWGGQSPGLGFDCSGLVWYAFNPVLKQQLPRTANNMYQSQAYQHVAQNALRQGDLIFFSISKHNVADHMGVYLGEGQFIEAPRTGLTIRISQLDENFWQAHYLGARRVLTEKNII